MSQLWSGFFLFLLCKRIHCMCEKLLIPGAMINHMRNSLFRYFFFAYNFFLKINKSFHRIEWVDSCGVGESKRRSKTYLKTFTSIFFQIVLLLIATFHHRRATRQNLLKEFYLLARQFRCFFLFLVCFTSFYCLWPLLHPVHAS